MADQFSQAYNEPLRKVKYQFEGTQISKAIIAKYLDHLKSAKTVAGLHSRLGSTLQELDELNAFQEVNVSILPGKQFDTALVDFVFKDREYLKLTPQFLSNDEGGSIEAFASVQNIRQRADLTYAAVRISPNT